MARAVRPDAAATVKIWIDQRTDRTAAFERWIDRQAQFAQHRQIRTKARRYDNLVDGQRAIFAIMVAGNRQRAASLLDPRYPEGRIDANRAAFDQPANLNAESTTCWHYAVSGSRSAREKAAREEAF